MEKRIYDHSSFCNTDFEDIVGLLESIRRLNELNWPTGSEVEKCIYSQLCHCSSTQVAGMMEGVLHHCTDMEIIEIKNRTQRSTRFFTSLSILYPDVVPKNTQKGQQVLRVKNNHIIKFL